MLKCDSRDVERRVGLSSMSGVQWFRAVNEKSVVILGICEFRKNYCDFYWFSKNIKVTVSDILGIC